MSAPALGNLAELGQARMDIHRAHGTLMEAGGRFSCATVDGEGFAAMLLNVRVALVASELSGLHEPLEAVESALRAFEPALEQFNGVYPGLSARSEEAAAALLAAEEAADEAAARYGAACLAGQDWSVLQLLEEELRDARYARACAEDECDVARHLLREAWEQFDGAAIAAAAAIAGLYSCAVGRLGIPVSTPVDVSRKADPLDALRNLWGLALLGASSVVDDLDEAGDDAWRTLTDLLRSAAAGATELAEDTVRAMNRAALWRLVVAGKLLGPFERLVEQLGLLELVDLRIVLLALLNGIPPLRDAVFELLEHERIDGPLDVALLDPSELDADAREALRTLNQSSLTTTADYVEWAGLADDLGGGDKAVVDIAQVHKGDEVFYVVTIPSTQDWNLTGDSPAPNDLAAALWIMLFPDISSRLQVGVLEAMRIAGMPEGANVIFNGWSLGGIVAAEMARDLANDPNALYVPVGVVAAGSCIDRIASEVEFPVAQVKHADDPVHILDLVLGFQGDGNQPVAWDVDLDDVDYESDTLGHSNDAYQRTARTEASVLDPAIDDYLAGDDGEQMVTTHTLVALSEAGSDSVGLLVDVT